MKKIVLLLSGILFSASVVANQSYSNSVCPTLAQYTGTGLWDYYSGAFKKGDPLYAVQNKNYNLRAIEPDAFECTFSSDNGLWENIGGCILDIIEGPDVTYAFSQDSFLNSNPTTVYTGSSDKTAIFRPNRGIEYVGVAVKANDLPAQCNISKLYWQNAPTISKVALNMPSGSFGPIYAEVSSTYDTAYSKAVVEGVGIKYNWRFTNMSYSDVFIYRTTTSKNITLSPEYDGQYMVSVTITDGTYTDFVNLGTVMYNGGVTPCSGTICQEPGH